MITLIEGKITPLQVGLKGMMNELFLETQRHQIKRAHEGRVREGQIFSKAYGYRSKIRDGLVVKGEKEIDPEQAKIVERVFTLCAEGHSCVSTAQTFNAEGIPSPGGGKWSRSTLYNGYDWHPSGILNNTLYIGKHVWNVRSKKINPDTGQKVIFINPQSQWVTVDVPELRIISDELWYRAEKQKLLRRRNQQTAKRVHTKNPFSGLVLCGSCGSTKILGHSKRFVCSGYLSRRSCDNARGMQLEDVGYHVFRLLQQQLDAQSSEAWRGSLEDFFATKIQDDQEDAAKMADLTQKIESLTEEMDKTNAPMQELISKSRAYHDQRLFLQASSHEPAVEIRDDVKSELMQALERLRVGILDPQKHDHWHARLLLLLDKIILHPIARSQKGETVEVVTREHAWPEFYHMMQFNPA